MSLRYPSHGCDHDFLLPFYRKLNLVSVYAYQEKRFGSSARTILSLTFQLLRAFAEVTVYGISIVLQSIVGIPFALSVVILGVVTIVYDMLGGMAAVVLSDVIQMVILYLGIVLCGAALMQSGLYRGVATL